MAKITAPKDCGNAPRKLFLKDYHVAMAQGDLDMVREHITEDLEWDIVGGQSTNSSSQYVTAIQTFPLWQVSELTIESIITHGNEAAVQGQVITPDQSRFVFCSLYRFKGFKGTVIRSIRTFLVRTDD